MSEPGDLIRRSDGRSEGLFDSRTFFAVMLSLAIWYGWLAIFPPAPPPEAEVAASSSPGASDPAASSPGAAAAGAPDPAGGAEAAARRDDVVEDRDVAVTFCDAAAVVNTSRGALRSVELQDHQDRFHTQTLLTWAMSLFSGPWLPYGEEPGRVHPLSPAAEVLVAGVGPVGAQCAGSGCDRAPGVVIEDAAPGRVVTVGHTAEGVEIRRTLRQVEGAPCRVEVDVTWTNSGDSAVRGLWVGMHDVVEPSHGRFDIGFHPIVSSGGSVTEYADPTKIPDDGVLADEPTDWFGFTNTYFAAVAVAGTEAEPGAGRFVTTWRRASPTVDLAGGAYVIDRELTAGGSHTERFTLYLGPKRLADLGAVDGRLTSIVQLGFFSLFATPLLYLLGWLHGVLGDWALSIVALTFLVKALFFRLSQQSYVSSQQMQAVQPEIEKLRAEFKDNQEELNRRMMALFRDRGVNPAAGCLPMVVQMPVWIALYSVLQTSVELYHARFLYIRDLTAADPYMVMPTVVVGLMLVQQRQMPTGNMDPSQAQIMRWMPLVFGVLFFSLPAGLLLYIFVNMVLSIAQQAYIKQTYKPQTQAVPGG
ncbi:MAG TPA: YidC/Oxa1 family insertase periplasmic-domain containing protein [Myxococcota bacterium]|nr:YidC/Oxa1 family insertase periplasmic-domain containing protein [Myxococcota bacterium]